MSLPAFSTQAELFSTTGLSRSLFAATDRYRLFALKVYPKLAQAHDQLAACYCTDNGRVAVEPVLLLGVSVLQYLEGIPDRQAAEMVRYHAGWNFALNRQLGDDVFHPTTLVNFRQRLVEHDLSAIGFTTVLDALVEAGLVSRKSRQRLDSTQMLGRVARMSRLDVMRETLRLALRELAAALGPEVRPAFWLGLWERYVESQTDYRAGSETLARKLVESGADAWQLLEWLRQPARSALATGTQVQLLARVFAEQFEVQSGPLAPAPREKITVPPTAPSASEPAQTEPHPTPVPTETNPAPSASGAEAPLLSGWSAEAGGSPPVAAAKTAPEAMAQSPQEATPGQAAAIAPKAKKELASDRVQNPHEPEATYSVKGQGENKKEHVGYKIQVAETVCEAILIPGEPTRNFLTGILTHPAYESDEAGAQQMEQEQTRMGLEPPPVQYVDGAYVSAQKLAQAQAEGRELIGPAQASPHQAGRFAAEDFQVRVEERQAVCPAGQVNTQCSRLEEESSGKVNYRFEFSTHCHDCPLRERCLGKGQRHRTLVVGEHHTVLQARRVEQQTDAFKQRMKHRNAIEGTQSELVRAHDLRQARYRGLDKVRLQNYFAGAACNIKRWLRRLAWEMGPAALGAGQTEAAATH